MGKTISAALVIGTRGSALALWQARHVADALRGLHPRLSVEEKIIRTAGDLDQTSPLSAGGDRGVFVRRLEQALLAEEVDLAVHSLKDMPTAQPEGLTLSAIMRRHDPRDVIVSTAGWTLDELPAGSVLGTGSPRRACQILHARPDLIVRSIRGNVDTRIRKMQAGEVDALVLALAGIERLGIDSVPVRPLDVGRCVPAVGQGALGLETRTADAVTHERIAALHHVRSAACVVAERAFLRRLGGGCLAPATAYAVIEEDRLQVEALVGGVDGSALLISRESGPLDQAETIGSRLAERLIVEGADRLLAQARAQEQDGSGG